MSVCDELDITIIGGGFSGICALIRAKQELPNASIAVFEKGESIAGTWAKNTYPGLSCDIPSKLYSYSFALESEWSREYASQPEILSYMHSVVSSFKVSSHIQLRQECEGAEWLEEELRWLVHLVDGSSGRRYTKRSRYLITAVGFCDVPNGAEDIHSIENFQGPVFHSSNWDHSLDFRNKDILVIGNGCSANQFIPHLLNKTSIRSITQVMRSAHWIAPKADRSIHQWEKWLLRTFPGANWLARFWIAAKLDFAFAAFKVNRTGRALRSVLQSSIISYMKQAAPSKYHDILIPEFDFGAKRPVLDHGYLNALHDSRITLLRSGSLAVTGPREVQTAGGEKVHADMIILANGFKTQQLLTPMCIKGRSGVELPDLWHQSGSFASAYMGVSVAGFPNLFLLTGPNTLPSGHSTLAGIECSVEYILRLVTHIQASFGTLDRSSIEVSLAAQKRFNYWIQEKMKGLVYKPEVRNWYTDRCSGQNTLIWPGSQFTFWWSRCVRKPQWSDFEIRLRK